MKIAIVSDTFLPQVNGVSNTFTKMMEYMDKQNVDYQFFVPLWENNDHIDSDRIQRFESFKPWFYPECRLAIPNKHNYIQIKDALDNFEPDLLHIATEFTLGHLGLRYGRERNIPMIMSYHTDIPGYLKYYNLQVLENAVWAYFRWFHSFALKNLVPSEATMEQLKRQDFHNLAYWKRGIDGNRYSPLQRNEALHQTFCEKDELLLLYVGRVALEKELNVLLDAVKILNERGKRFKLVIVGDGPYRKEIEEQAIPNVICAGYKRGTELQQIYASSDIFVFPSSSETYGNVILEALASGLPIVAPFSGGVKENLIDGCNGLAFEAGNALDMADKINTLLTNNAFRKETGKQARTSIENKTWDSVFRELFNLYTAILHSRIISQRLSA